MVVLIFTLHLPGLPAFWFLCGTFTAREVLRRRKKND